MVDKAKLDQMLENLARYARVLESLNSAPREALLSNQDKVGNAKYHFVIAIECCIDIANHVIASEGYRFPRDNGDSFVVLVEQGILADDRKEPLRAMSRFRNRLVHLYWDVDDQAVADYLATSLEEFDGFARTIAQRFG